MRYAVIADIHANPTALRRVFEDAESQGATAFVCLGDVVGYGPCPAETVELVRARCAFAIAGNHDDAVSGRADASAFIDLAGDAVERHREALSAEALGWLRSLPHELEFGGARAAHGDFTDPSAFNYVETEDDARANFAATGAQLAFVGHTHRPGLFLTGASGRVYAVGPTDFELEDGKRYLVNPGSVGYPRESDGKCLSSYVIYDSDERTVTFRFLAFSVASVMQRGKNPRRIRAMTVAALAVACALAAAALVWWLKPRAAARAQDPALVVAERTVRADGAGDARANLKLESRSAPVQLRVESRDAKGRTLSCAEQEVKRSSSKAFAVPAAAAEITFTVTKRRTEDAAAIESFAPGFARKGESK